MRMRMMKWAPVLVALLAAFATPSAQTTRVTANRLLAADEEPENWLTYSGAYHSRRHSRLDRITPDNAADLELKWVYQAQVFGAWQATPLVVDGIMYITQRPNDVVALDARTGRVFWIYHYTPSPEQRVCCGSNNRGLAMLGDTLYMGTLDAHLVAIDAATGRPVWDVEVADPSAGYSLTLAPLAVKDKILVGVGGGEFGIRGFVAAYDAQTGAEAWRFYTIPGPGEPGHETWEPCPPASDTFCDPEAWRHGGGSIWVTGSYDPELDLTYWGVGNAGPDWNPDQRPGDNLYSDSVVALDPDTGALRWHFQFTPNDRYDYDSVQVPVLADLDWDGTPTRAMLWANRNGFFYVLDRVTGRFLRGAPFVKVNWASGLDNRGRPIQTPQPPGEPTWPGNQGGTNWYSPSYSPRTGLFYVSAWENYASIFRKEPTEYRRGDRFGGGGATSVTPVPGAPGIPGLRRATPINDWTDAVGNGAVLALDPATGETRWRFRMFDVTDSGLLTTASDVLFTGSRDGYFYALDARTGEQRWRASLGAQIVSGPATWAVDGRQYVSIISGHALFVFGLGDDETE